MRICRVGFLNFGAINILGWLVVCNAGGWRAILYILGC